MSIIAHIIIKYSIKYSTFDAIFQNFHAFPRIDLLLIKPT